MNLYIEPTDLRKDITYIIITNWIRFIILGFVPVTLLVMLYANIHTNLKKRKKRANGKYRTFRFSFKYKFNIVSCNYCVLNDSNNTLYSRRQIKCKFEERRRTGNRRSSELKTEMEKGKCSSNVKNYIES